MVFSFPEEGNHRSSIEICAAEQFPSLLIPHIRKEYHCVKQHWSSSSSNRIGYSGDTQPIMISELTGKAYSYIKPLVPEKNRVRIMLASELTRTEDGSWTQVRHVVIKESELEYLNKLGSLTAEDPVSEISATVMLSKPGHKNVIRAFDFWQCNQGRLYLVTPYIQGKDLFYRIKETGGGGFSEEVTRKALKQVVEGLIYMKCMGIAHRDISAENVMIGDDGTCLLIDLGMATLVPNSSKASRVLIKKGRPRGKMQYMSFEVYKEEDICPFASDIFSLGVVFYIMLTGCILFKNPWDEAFEAVMMGELDRVLARHISKGVKKISRTAKDLLQRMLDPNMLSRITLQEILQHPWVSGQEERKLPFP